MFRLKTSSYFVLCWLLWARVVWGQCPTSGSVVTVSNNSGANINGSLAWAIGCLSSQPSLTTVKFSISGATEIQPSVALVVSKSGALIDGSSQAGIILDGTSVAGSTPNGLVITAPNVTVQGLVIRGFTASAAGNGILVNSNNVTIQNNTLTSNRIGIGTGTSAAIFLFTNNTIGDSGAGNTAGGISITGIPSAGVVSFNDIASNGGVGVSAPNGVVLIRENSIFCNTGGGITRPAQAVPHQITLANTQLIRGTAAANAVIEVYVHSTAGCSAAPCQGKGYLGTVTTAANGIWSLPLSAGAVAAGNSITATSTLAGNSTSAFSTCATVADCSALNASINTTDVSCFGLSNGSASALPSGSTLSFAWNTGSTNATLNNQPAGTYTVTVTNNANGCTDSATASIDQPAALGLSFSNNNLSCFGENDGSVTATASGGSPTYSYAWNNGGNTPTLSNLSAGTYTLTLSDANNCTLVQSTGISQPPPLSAGLAPTNANCAGSATGAITATPTGGTPTYNYNWSTGASSAVLANVPAGTYTVTVTDANGCIFTQSASVGEPPPLTINLQTTDETAANANNGSANATGGGGTPGYFYAWSTGANSQQISNLAPGVYTVTLTDNKGCTLVEVAVINSFDCAGFSPGLTSTPIDCAGNANGSANASPSGGTPVYTYAWNTGANTNSISNLPPGAYSVTITDALGCTTTDDVLISQPPVLLMAPSATGLSGPGSNDGSASANASGGTPPYNYAWNTGGSAAQLNSLPPGTYTVTVTDTRNCTQSGSATVAGSGPGGPCSALPVYALYTPGEVCGNTLFTLNLDDLYPHPDVLYRWLLPGGDTLTTSAPRLDLLANSSAYSGNYFVLRDSAGCRSASVGGAPVEVLSLPPGAVFAGNDTTVCAPGLVVLRALPPPQGSGQWLALGSAKVDDPSKFLTAARNLAPGRNVFVWRISLGSCPEAAADTVVYFVETAVQVQDDGYSIPLAGGVAVMEMLLNDGLGGLQDTVVTVPDAPTTGDFELVDSGHVFFRYKAAPGFRGRVQFHYVVCNPAGACGLSCDTALVTIDVLSLPVVQEALVLEAQGPNGLLQIKGAESFGRVAIAVTDRWGDVVFEEKDYQNDKPWLGDYRRSGRYLPAGAYYFLLQAYDGEEQVGGAITGVIHLFEQP